jgi:hypothetical protein
MADVLAAYRIPGWSNVSGGVLSAMVEALLSLRSFDLRQPGGDYSLLDLWTVRSLHLDSWIRGAGIGKYIAYPSIH